jgi:transposase
MSKNTPSSTGWKEQRRLHALRLKRKGWRPTDIAMALGVTKGAVSQWFAGVDKQGEKALLSRPHSGRPPELTSAEKHLIPEFLSHGAEAYGFRGEVWTCPRVRKVIEWEFGVSYHKSHVARVLKELKWTPQMPVERAAQRDEGAITQWRSEVWAEMKKRLGWSGARWFLWTKRASICCPPRFARMRRVVRRPFCACFKRVIICPS